MSSRLASSKRAAPWARPKPKKVQKRGTKHLSTAQKKRAKQRARRAGRPYPNMVDDMQEARKSRAKPSKKKATKKKSSRRPVKRRTTKQATKRRVGRAQSTRGERSRERDPRGGLTAAGRRAFHRREGANLKPGVKKKLSEMSRSEMKRKGSWAVRFYGRKQLPKLVDDAGKPTRFALSARAWGEPVPKTQAAARKIAEKGQRLLARARGR